MKKTTIQKISILFMIALTTSCISSYSFFNSKSKTKEVLLDKYWHDTLMNNRQAIKTAWLSFYNPLRSFQGPPHTEFCYVFTKQSELDACEIFPVEVFTISDESLDKLKADKNISIESLMVLNKDKVVSYSAVDNKFYDGTSLEWENNTWRFAGCGVLEKVFSDSLSMIYFKKKIPFYNVYISYAFGGASFVIYRKDGILMNMEYGGESIPLRGTLLRLIRQSESGGHF